MNALRLLSIALDAIAHNKMRSILTMLGIIIGVAAVITMLAIGQGAKKSIEEDIGKMGANMLFVRPGVEGFGVRGDPSAAQSLTVEDYFYIRDNQTAIPALSPQLTSRKQVIFGNANWFTQLQGVAPDFLIIRQMSVSEGVMFNEAEVHSAAKVCLLGKTVADSLFRGSSPLGKVIRFDKIPFTVIGILSEKGPNSFGQDQDDVILAPWTTVQKRVLGVTYLSAIYASASTDSEVQKAKEEIGTLMRASHRLAEELPDDFSIRTQQEISSTLTSTSQLLTVLLSSIAAISLLVGGIGIMNIMFVSVKERTREIGLRMAVGARGKDIMLQFLVESVLISVSGGIIGLLLGFGATAVLGIFLGWPTLIDPLSVLLSFVVCVFTGVFFGFSPAKAAAQLDPIEALRYE